MNDVAPRRVSRRTEPRPAPRRRMLWIGCALAAVLLIGWWFARDLGAGLAGRSPQASAVARHDEAPVFVSGVGNQTSAPFYLAGGTYRGAWSAWGEAAEFPPCTHSTELRAVDFANAQTAGGHVTDFAIRVDVPATGASDASDVHNLKPGEYYLDVTSACAWQITLSQQPD